MRFMPYHRATGPTPVVRPGVRPRPSGCPAVTRTAATALVALLLASCGGGGGGSPSASPSASSSAASSASTSPSASGSAVTPSGSAPADVTAATAQVKQNWETFFSPATPLDQKANLLQNGDQLKPLLEGFSSDPRVGQVSAQVTSVQFTSATTATVTYNLLLQGSVVQQNASGQAVLQNGVWKVSQATLCGLVQLSGNTALPGCG